MSGTSSARKPPRLCREPGCNGPALGQKARCQWHYLLHADLEAQEVSAVHRREHPKQKPDKHYFELYPDWRWCAGCCWVVPMYYVTGSRCKACARSAARASHVQRTYGITGAEERALNAWQDNRCFICGRKAVKRQLAVDHDHVTGDVRGLLCSDDKYGCNVLMARILDDIAAARRLVAYVQQTPLERMRAGEPPWQF